MKTILCFLLIMAFGILEVFSQNDNSDEISPEMLEGTMTILTIEQDSILNKLLDNAITCLGVPYRHGGKSKAGFDCSGYVMTMFMHIGVNTSPSSRDLFNFGRLIPDSEIQPGDILFFTGTGRRRGITHVALAYEVLENDIKFIHAASRGGVRFDYLSTPYYKSHYYKARRLPIFDLMEYQK